MTIENNQTQSVLDAALDASTFLTLDLQIFFDELAKGESEQIKPFAEYCWLLLTFLSVPKCDLSADQRLLVLKQTLELRIEQEQIRAQTNLDSKNGEAS